MCIRDSNNAGYGYRSSVEEGDIDDVNLLFNTNFFGPIELIKEVLPQMRANKNGAIVNVSSIAAVRSGVGSGYYAASKAALELMTEMCIRDSCFADASNHNSICKTYCNY